jgi:MFS family permease
MFIASFFAQDRRAMASSVFTLSIYFGSAIAAVSIVSVMGIGWRATFLLFGGVGFVLTLLSIPLISEARREAILEQA